MPDKCKCVDFQVLKLQESPDAVPHGEMPRHMQLYCDRYLTEKVVPGNRVTVMGIYSIKKVSQKGDKDRDGVGVGIRKPYLRVVGIQVDTEGPGRSSGAPLNPLEEEEFNRFSSRPDAFETIAKSIAPFIYGSEDIKKLLPVCCSEVLAKGFLMDSIGVAISTCCCLATLVLPRVSC
ncbi:minichromosome maintenance protein 5 [Desmophyllum pertusum]|uniref:Minichromosome maintenance protein 5 n=1 Tax=Desmophyllum pertusum TaxID=174260 RepID=A0A9W9YLS8_9CNID|nr:minichromosome maintenance protein 5 [Desmophyllum pertusum]